MRRLRPILAALALAFGPAPALAEAGFIDEAAFRSFAAGRVVRADYEDGSLFGHEQFLPDDRVIWLTADGTCLEGVWKAEGGSICYHYEDGDAPSCLRYMRLGDQLVGYHWDNSRGAVGYLGFIVRLSQVDHPSLSCDPAPVS